MTEYQGMVSEHEPLPKEESKENVYQPTDEEKKTIKRVTRFFDEAKKYRSKYDHKWLDYYEMFRGKQWKETRPSYRHSEVINFIFQEIQSVVPILTDTQPKISFLPTEPGDMPLANIIEKLFDYDWRKNKWSMQLLEAIYEAHIYGTGYNGVLGEVMGGEGKIIYKSFDPFYCFPDPVSTDVNTKGCYFIYAEPIKLRQAKKKHPKHAAYMKADLENLVGPEEKTQLGKARFQSPTDKKTSPAASEDYAFDSSKDNMTLEITCWYKDDEVVEEKTKKLNQETGEEKTVYVQKKKYPRGREIKIIGGVLIYDKEYPYDDFEDRFCPIARLQNYILPREFYGISEVEQLESPQRIFNKLVSFSLDVLTLMGNPIWVVDSTANVDTDALINRPGLIVEKDPSGQVRREEGVQLQPYVMALIDRMQSWFNEISGSTDITRGQKPEGVTAASAIRTLQDASQTRLRLKSRILDTFLQDIGQMYVSRIFQLYTAPKIFRITNDGNATQYFKVSIEEGTDGKKVFNMREITEQPGMPPVESDQKSYESMAKFDVSSSMGSTLPFAKEEKFALAERLYNMQIIDAEEVLNSADYPNKEKVLQRMQERQAQAAQAQMMQQ